MEKTNKKGIYQLENGMWAFRFVLTIDGKKISSRKTTDEFGQKLKTKKQAIKARDSAILHARLDRERQKKISRRTMAEVYAEYCEKGRTDRAYQTIRKQDSLWCNHLKPRFGKRFVDDISYSETQTLSINFFILVSSFSFCFVFCISYFLSLLYSRISLNCTFSSTGKTKETEFFRLLEGSQIQSQRIVVIELFGSCSKLLSSRLIVDGELFSFLFSLGSEFV